VLKRGGKKVRYDVGREHGKSPLEAVGALRSGVDGSQ